MNKRSVLSVFQWALGLPGLVVAACVLIPIGFLSGCGGGSGGLPAPEPWVVLRDLQVSQNSAFVKGPLVIAFQAETNMAVYNTGVHVFLAKTSSAETCGDYDYRLYYTVIRKLGFQDQDSQPLEYVEGRFMETEVSYVPGAGTRIADVRQTMVVPYDVEPGTYRVVIEQAKEAGTCLYSQNELEIRQPGSPDLIFTYTGLSNNSFMLPDPEYGEASVKDPPAMLLNMEIANIGLPMEEGVPLSITPWLTIRGQCYSLLVANEDVYGNQVLNDRFTFLPGCREGSAAPYANRVLAGAVDVIGTTMRVYLPENVKTVLSTFPSGERPVCNLDISIDGQTAVADGDRTNNSASLSAVFLAGVTPKDLAEHDPNYPEEVYYSRDTKNFGNPQMASIQYDEGPLYLRYKKTGTGDDATSTEGAYNSTYALSFVSGLLDWKASLFESTLNVTYNLKNRGQLGVYSGNLSVLGYKKWQAEKKAFAGAVDFTPYEYHYEYFAFKKFWPIMPCIRLHYGGGFQGIAGISGKLGVNQQDDFVKLDMSSVSPYLLINVFLGAKFEYYTGSLSYDLPLSAGLLAEWVIFEVQPTPVTSVTYYPAMGDGKPAASVMEARYYIRYKAFSVRLRWYVDLILYVARGTIFEWPGPAFDIPIAEPVSLYLGPANTYAKRIDGTPKGIVGIVFEPIGGAGGYSYQWTGQLELKTNTTYTFRIPGVKRVKISGNNFSKTFEFDLAECSHWSNAFDISIPADSDHETKRFTIWLETDLQCMNQTATSMTWFERSASGGSGDKPECLQTWYYNDLKWYEPVFFECTNPEDGTAFDVKQGESLKPGFVNTAGKGFSMKMEGSFVSKPQDPDGKNRNYGAIIRMDDYSSVDPIEVYAGRYDLHRVGESKDLYYALMEWSTLKNEIRQPFQVRYKHSQEDASLRLKFAPVGRFGIRSDYRISSTGLGASYAMEGANYLKFDHDPDVESEHPGKWTLLAVDATGIFPMGKGYGGERYDLVIGTTSGDTCQLTLDGDLVFQDTGHVAEGEKTGPIRESLLPLEIKNPGYHVIEAAYANAKQEPKDAYGSMVSTLRFSPYVASEQALYFYANDQELKQALNESEQGYSLPQALLIWPKTDFEAHPSLSVFWRSADDCRAQCGDAYPCSNLEGYFNDSAVLIRQDLEAAAGQRMRILGHGLLPDFEGYQEMENRWDPSNLHVQVDKHDLTGFHIAESNLPYGPLGMYFFAVTGDFLPEASQALSDEAFGGGRAIKRMQYALWRSPEGIKHPSVNVDFWINTRLYGGTEQYDLLPVKCDSAPPESPWLCGEYAVDWERASVHSYESGRTMLIERIVPDDYDAFISSFVLAGAMVADPNGKPNKPVQPVVHFNVSNCGGVPECHELRADVCFGETCYRDLEVYDWIGEKTFAPKNLNLVSGTRYPFTVVFKRKGDINLGNMFFDPLLLKASYKVEVTYRR